MNKKQEAKLKEIWGDDLTDVWYRESRFEKFCRHAAFWAAAARQIVRYRLRR